MLDKSKRLNLKRNFRIVSQGKKDFTSHFTLMSRRGENTRALVGIALSKQQFKSAVERNRAKRLTAEAVAIVYPSLRNNLNLVIIPKTGVLKSHPEELAKELQDVKTLYSVD